jgi:hypothetical protein
VELRDSPIGCGKSVSTQTFEPLTFQPVAIRYNDMFYTGSFRNGYNVTILLDKFSCRFCDDVRSVEMLYDDV